MGKLKNNLFKIGLLVLMILSLVGGTVIPAFADNSTSKQPPIKTSEIKLRTVQGKIITLAASSFVIQNENQTPVTINVDNATRYYKLPLGEARSFISGTVKKDNLQAEKNKRPLPPASVDLKNAHIPANWQNNPEWLATFESSTKYSDLQLGDKVMANITTDGKNLARQVTLITAPVIQQVKGTISAINASSITITPTNASGVVLTIDNSTKVDLKGILIPAVGNYAAATYNHNTMVAQVISIQAKSPVPPVAPKLTSITVTPAAPTSLPVGKTQQFRAVAHYSNSTTLDVTNRANWASSSNNFTSISRTGLAKGLAAGTTNITATFNGLISPDLPLTVTGNSGN